MPSFGWLVHLPLKDLSSKADPTRHVTLIVEDCPARIHSNIQLCNCCSAMCVFLFFKVDRG